MDDTDSTLEIRQYLALLRRWLWLIALGTLLGAASAYVSSRLATPIYQASSTLLISEGQKATGPDYNALLLSERLAQTYAQMLKGKPVLAEVERRLERSVEGVSVTVEPVRDTQLLRVRVSHSDPGLAAAVANAIPAVFVDLNAETQAARFSTSLQSLSAEMEQLQHEIEVTQAELDRERGTGLEDGKQARLETLVAQYRATYAGLLASYEEIRTAQARETDSLTVYEPAEVPRAPSSPRTRQNVLLAAVVGAMLAAGVAFLLEYLDDTLKRPEDVERATGLSTYATIARFPQPDDDGPVMVREPQSAVAEAYRVLRTNIQFATLGLGGTGVVLLVTSAQPVEGKTTTLANLGVALAQVGKRVLLVDTDLRRPALHEHFHLSNGQGLTSLYLQADPDVAAVLQDTGVEGLRVLTSGPLPANPAEILGFPQTARLLERLRSLADYILFDSPPVLSVADASILAQRVDGVIVVAEVGRTRTEVFRRALAALQGVQARVVGVVLNKLVVRGGRYGYYYYPYYGHSGAKRKRSGAERKAALLAFLLPWRAPGVDVAGRRILQGAWALLFLAAVAVLFTAAALLYQAYGSRFGLPAAGAEVAAPSPTRLAPTAVPTELPATPRAVSALPTPAPPTATPEPTAEPSGAPGPAEAAPTATATPAPTEVPLLAAGRHGVAAGLRLRDERTTYAVDERVYFRLQVENRNLAAVQIGILGLDGGAGVPFRSTWSQRWLEPGQPVTVEDHLAFTAPGTYTVTAAICFSPADLCQRPGADWEQFPPGVLVTVE